MKVGIITQTNEKGQIVIPKKFRDALAISPHTHLYITITGTNLSIAPIKDIVTREYTRDVLVTLLTKTQGSWQDDDFAKTQRKREQIEKEAAKKRRKTW